MINPEHPLPVVRQCELLNLARSTAYYQPLPTSERDLLLMRRLDELHLKWPFLGARKLRDLLNGDGFEVGRKHVVTLMRKMGISAVYRQPKTSTPGSGPEHRIYPYLLKDLSIERANHVWAADITYLPMAKGFVYLVAIIFIAHSDSGFGSFCNNPIMNGCCSPSLPPPPLPLPPFGFSIFFVSCCLSRPDGMTSLSVPCS